MGNILRTTRSVAIIGCVLISVVTALLGSGRVRVGYHGIGQNHLREYA